MIDFKIGICELYEFDFLVLKWVYIVSDRHRWISLFSIFNWKHIFISISQKLLQLEELYKQYKYYLLYKFKYSESCKPIFYNLFYKGNFIHLSRSSTNGEQINNLE